jgi:hypothetical protein
MRGKRVDLPDEDLKKLAKQTEQDTPSRQTEADLQAAEAAQELRRRSKE